MLASAMAIRRAKVICTLGPACDSLENLRALVDAGMDVARFNFSHGTHEEHAARLQRLRQVSEEKGKPIAALQDICGPKVRTGTFGAQYVLPQGGELTILEAKHTADPSVLPIPYEGLAGDVRVGDRILLDDGRIVLFVLGIEGERIRVIQRQIIGVARRVRRPVIVATEMLQSMTKATRPTRAEAGDVATAVF